MNRIAILDGYDSGPGFDGYSAYWRKRKGAKKATKYGRVTKKQGKSLRRFKKAAKTCANVVKRNPRRSYRACMAQKLRKSKRR